MSPDPVPARSAKHGAGGWRPWAPSGALVALYLAGALPLVFSGNMRGRGAWDAINYHILTIRTFAAELPWPDLAAYPVTTTPLYHLLLAVVARVAGPSVVILELTGALFTIGLLVTAARWCTARAGPRVAFACCLPLAVSPYVFQSGVWPLPDNAGWWGVLAILLIALDRGASLRVLLLGAGVLLVLVLVRQIHVWAAAMLWAAAWIGPAGDGGTLGWREVFSRPGGRFRRAVIVGLATLPAFGAIAYFGWLWGGLTPPMFQSMYGHPGPSAPALILSLLGVFSLFFVGYFGAAAAGHWRRHPWIPVLAACAGALVAVIPETTYSLEEGRFSGLWNGAAALGIVGGRTSVLVVILSTAGGLAVSAWAAALPFRDRFVLLLTMAAFCAAQSASPMVWQRYNEPFVLMLCAVLAARIAGDGPRAEPARMRAARLAGPLALGVMLAALTAMIQARAQPAPDIGLDPKAREHPVP